MSPDQLNDSTSHMERAVRAVLAGQTVTDAACGYDVAAYDLTDAITTYEQAGRSALVHHAAVDKWWQINITFHDLLSCDRVFATHVLPALHDTLNAWWFIRKPPGFRLRTQADTGARAAMTVVLDQLVTDGHLQRWHPVIYEPETVVFGGDTSMKVAHELFAADSREIMRLPSLHLPVGQRELSVLLCMILMRAAGLEWYEAGDVWDRVITVERRSALGDITPELLGKRAAEIRTLLLADTSVLLGDSGPLAAVNCWGAAFHRAGRRLGTLARNGTLGRGLREVLSLHMIFHWNRLGLSLPAQSLLAAAARTATFRDRPDGTEQHRARC